MKVVINKLVGDLGEQWAVEFPISNDLLKAGGEGGPVKAIEAAIAPILRVVDNRLMEMNQRLIDHNRIAQTLTPEGMLAVRQCVEVMYGQRRVPPDGPEGKGTQGVVTTQAKVEKAAGALEHALEGVDQG